MENKTMSTAMLPMANLMDYRQLQPARLGKAPIYMLSLATIATLPPLPAIDWTVTGKTAPQIVNIPGFKDQQALPAADSVIITWTNAEWAALHHVFCDSSTPMSYNAIAKTENWDGDWLLYNRNFSSVLGQLTGVSPSKKRQAWGRFRMVKANGKNILLFKSDMHISKDGPGMPVIQMVDQIIDDCEPTFILTTGTAGGARVQDDLGTANLTNAAQFDLTGTKFSSKLFRNELFNNAWTIADSKLAIINNLLMQTPITPSHILELLQAMNHPKNKPVTNYTLSDVSNDEIKPGAIPPKINNLPAIPVLSSNGYSVATTDGKFKNYAAMEMDDAAVAMEAKAKNISFGVIRNISDPVQNTTLPKPIQKSWAGTIYNTYGFYTSYNSALAAWAVIS